MADGRLNVNTWCSDVTHPGPNVLKIVKSGGFESI
jgi:hypothetical protein